jgi:LCP family protein required for cell wall assembly
LSSSSVRRRPTESDAARRRDGGGGATGASGYPRSPQATGRAAALGGSAAVGRVSQSAPAPVRSGRPGPSGAPGKTASLDKTARPGKAARPGKSGKSGKTAKGGKVRKRRSDPLWARLMVLAGALLMMVSGGTIVGGKILAGAATKNIASTDLLGDAGTHNTGNTIDGPLNILLVGVDQRPEWSPTELVRSDSILILHVSMLHDQMYLMTLPRDLLVSIPSNPATKFAGGKEKINAAFAFGNQNGGGRQGGFKLLARTITGFTGIKFNAAAIIDFGGFQAVTEQLGGVDMCIDQRVESHHIGFDKAGHPLTPYVGADGERRDPRSIPEVYEPGCRHLKAWQALDYVRQRKGAGLPNGDYDRQRHQQQFLKALLKEAKKQGVTSNPAKAAQIMASVGKALTVDTNGIDLVDWAYTMRNVTDNDLVMIKTNAGKVNPIEVPGVGSCEQLSEESKAMFAALQADTLGTFVAQHSDFVATDTLS